MAVHGYAAPIVSELVGIPYATLDSWVRTGFFIPEIAQASGKGSRRLYSFSDVCILKILQLLRVRGLNSETQSQLINLLRTGEKEVEAYGKDDIALFKNGEFIIEKKERVKSISYEELEDIYFIIPIGRFIKELKRDITARDIHSVIANEDRKVKVG
ncbi:MerR family transcriptional regulator [Paenibacillus sp. FSL R7-0048]|uniref:helix-turn-helix domain-containing protein n=1 Tax=Paenibacillus TaxID=44249 RepID=UPI00096F7F86|nr:MerR family transcriptional regulator [Paenibacillus odorifer]OMD87845.1 hypothetical protein BSK53_02330 [Paenibacillus odorifer]